MRLNEVPLLTCCCIWLKLMVRKRNLGPRDWEGGCSPDGIQCGLSLIHSKSDSAQKENTKNRERLKTKTKPTLKPTLPYVPNLEWDQRNFSLKYLDSRRNLYELFWKKKYCLEYVWGFWTCYFRTQHRNIWCSLTTSGCNLFWGCHLQELTRVF